jgi:hypothetical protein
MLSKESNHELTTRVKRIELFHERFNNHFGNRFDVNMQVQMSLNRTRVVKKASQRNTCRATFNASKEAVIFP